MKLCIQCGLLDSEDKNFCEADGSELVVVRCPKCDYTAIGKHTKFCPSCGTPVHDIYGKLLVKI